MRSNLDNLELAHSQLQDSQISQQQWGQQSQIQQLQQHNNQVYQSLLQSNVKFWNKQFRLENQKPKQDFNINLINQIEINDLNNIQKITPAVRNIIESKINLEDMQNGNIEYQQYYKIFQSCCSAIRYLNQFQIAKSEESQQLYLKFKKLKEMSAGIDVLKKQHLKKQRELMEQKKQIQWKINQYKLESKELGQYKCFYCQQLFKHKDQLQAHTKKKHQEIVDEVLRQHKLQRKYNNPDVIFKKIENEKEVLEELKDLEKQVEELPQTAMDKEEEVVSRIQDILNQNMNNKIHEQVIIMKQEREKDNKLYEQRQTDVKQQINEMDQVLNNFQDMMEELRKKQHNLIDEQYLSDQILDEFKKEQIEIEKKKQLTIEQKILVNHKDILERQKLDREHNEQIQFRGTSSAIDNKEHWFFDAQLSPTKRTLEDLKKAGLEKYVQPDKIEFNELIMEESASLPYSHSKSKDVTAEYEESATVTSQNIQEDELQNLSMEREKRQQRLQELEEERIQKQMLEKRLNEAVGDLESDFNSLEEDEDDEYYEISEGENQEQVQYEIVKPIDIENQLKDAETKYLSILNKKQKQIGELVDPVQKQEALFLQNKDLQKQLDDIAKIEKRYKQDKNALSQAQKNQKMELIQLINTNNKEIERLDKLQKRKQQEEDYMENKKFMEQEFQKFKEQRLLQEEQQRKMQNSSDEDEYYNNQQNMYYGNKQE